MSSDPGLLAVATVKHGAIHTQQSLSAYVEAALRSHVDKKEGKK